MALVSSNHHRNLLGAIAVLLLILVGLSYAFPLHFWGINFPSFLAGYVGPLLLLIPVLLSVGLHHSQGRLAALGRVPRWAWSLGVAGIMWYLHYHLYTETQLYGDTRNVLSTLGEDAPPHHYTIAGALSPAVLGSKNGEGFTYGLALGVQSMIGCSIWGAFRVLTAAIGAVYAFVWMEFVLGKLQTPVVRLLAAALGLLGGMSQVFYGHPEVYAAPMLIFTGYLMALVHYLEGRQDKWLLATGALLLLSIRAHSLGYAFVPTFAYALLARLRGEAWLGWRRGGLLLLGGSLALGAVGYFTVFKAGAEKVASDGTGKNLFLTLTGDKTDDNLYAMFTGWHAWDFLQEVLLVSLPAVGLLVAILALALKGERWNRPQEIALAMAFVILAGLVWAVDPWLSMPRDWDLCGLLAPPLLLMAVLFLARHETQLRAAWLPLALLTGLATLQFSAVLVNHNKKQVHARIIAAGKHVFVTRHGGGIFMIRHALGSGSFILPEHRAHLKDVLDFLATHKTKSQQSEYAFFCQYAGVVYMDGGEYPAAEQYLLISANTAPDEFQSAAELAAVEWELKKPEAALNYARRAIRTGNQSSKTWAIAIRAALALDQQPLALQIAEDYRSRHGDPLAIVPELHAAMGGAAPDTVATVPH